MSCTLVHVYTSTRFRWNCYFSHQGSEVPENSHFILTLGRTSIFTRFFQLQSNKIHLTKTQSLSSPIQLRVKSQKFSFFSFPLKHFNEFTIAHSACYEAHLLCPPWFGYANKTNNQLKTYNFTKHTALCFSFSSLSWHTHHSGRSVCGACYCLTEFATYMSTVVYRQFTTLKHVYCKSVLSAVTCARLVSGQSYSAYFIMHVCYRSCLSSNTYIDLWETDLSVAIGDFTGNIINRLK